MAIRYTYAMVYQIDRAVGRILDALDSEGLADETIVVFTSDHGDFLGDHWLGEKELFYDTVQRVPFIVVDPAAAADATRGTTDPPSGITATRGAGNFSSA